MRVLFHYDGQKFQTGEYQIVIEGYNEDYRIEDIELDNVTICDETVTSNSPYLHIGEHVKGIKVRP